MGPILLKPGVGSALFARLPPNKWESQQRDWKPVLFFPPACRKQRANNVLICTYNYRDYFSFWQLVLFRCCTGSDWLNLQWQNHPKRLCCSSEPTAFGPRPNLVSPHFNLFFYSLSWRTLLRALYISKCPPIKVRDLPAGTAGPAHRPASFKIAEVWGVRGRGPCLVGVSHPPSPPSARLW